MEKHLRTDFGKSWKKFRGILVQTAPQIVETFRGTSLEDNFSQWYQWAMPQNGESSINFILRNERHSYSTTSHNHAAELAANNVMAKIGWYFGKAPLLRKVIRLNEASTELYLGQETKGYVSDRQEVKGNGFGNDNLRYTSSNFARPMNLDIDVGFTNPNSPRNGRNWFYQINIFDDLLKGSAQQVHQIIERAKLEGDK